MSTTPPDMRRVSLHTALGSEAACTATAFGAGFTLAADQSGSTAPVNIVVEHSVGPRHDAGNQSMTGDPLPGVCTGCSATMGNEAAMRGRRSRPCAARKVIAARHAAYLYSLIRPPRIRIRSTRQVSRSCTATSD